MNLHRKSTRPFQIKSINDEGEFTGYASVFDVKDSYGDVVIKGAFAKSLTTWAEKGKMPKMLWQHQTSEPIGVWQKMTEDEHGLYVEGKILLEAGALEKRAHTHMKAGSVDALSIGYSVAAGGYSYDEEQDAYLLKQVNLWEVSPVTFPANPEALIDSVKAALENGPKDFERLLRDAGLSRKEAMTLMSSGFSGLRKLRDAEGEGHEELAKQLNESLMRLCAR